MVRHVEEQLPTAPLALASANGAAGRAERWYIRQQFVQVYESVAPDSFSDAHTEKPTWSNIMSVDLEHRKKGDGVGGWKRGGGGFVFFFFLYYFVKVNSHSLSLTCCLIIKAVSFLLLYTRVE